jgi:tetratricopeptide (TPR) repeat protein
MNSVTVRRDTVVFPTYLPAPADKNPMFLEKRVYQGSNGKVYPLPFTDRIALTKTEQAWDAVHVENEFIRVMILPQLGGRIHVGQDKTNGYDFFYRQNVIKPALVGLAGPWISGGVEFNWPQHHRPSTFMPADVEIEKHPDGSVTVWLSEHEPMNRMKGMHGVCLHPGKSYIELKARVYNRTAMAQTFLWWANVATRVHERYQSFFPPDATYVADHAKRAMSEFPLCAGSYYGVDYATRARDGVAAEERSAAFVPGGDYPANDLSWYANIPVPTSYMCMGTEADFFGGYDHAREAGVVHVANHHISPGKKQWTWGNQEFGYAWDRNLTDSDGPYIELMAGVYTDNQPDFSFLMPGETKTWSQFWYPIQKIGPAQAANTEAAVSLRVSGGKARVGVSVSSAQAGARVRLEAKKRKATGRESVVVIAEWVSDLVPGQSLVETVTLPRGVKEAELRVSVCAADGREIVAYASVEKPREKKEVPPAATEPGLPAEIASNDELYVIGLHLEQYRHATRMPEDYWREALRRDPGDSRCLNALGRWHLRRGEFGEAEKCFRAAVERLTLRNPNPYDGEPHYNLGLALRFLGRDAEAYAAFYKATWNHAWQAAGYHALAEIDCMRGDWAAALAHAERALRVNADNVKARNLRVLVLRKVGGEKEAAGALKEAEVFLKETRALDPLDWWAREIGGETLTCDTQVRLDLALDYARAGFVAEALRVLEDAKPEVGSGTGPLVSYYRAWLSAKAGASQAEVARHFKAALKASPDYCFPARSEEIGILQFAMLQNPKDARAPYYLGNLFYDRRRHAEAIALWERAVKLDGAFSVVWRNQGIGYFNVAKKPEAARRAYERAFAANPRDARLLYERDQLWKRLGVAPAKRLWELAKYPRLTEQRDDLSVELCALLNQTGRAEEARGILAARRFQPWEGGEGQALGQFTRAQVLLGRASLEAGDAAKAVALLSAALGAPENLGEARHLLANASDVRFWLGEALAAAGRGDEARVQWAKAAAARGDFQEMSVRAFSEMTYYSARALERLGRKTESKTLLKELRGYARALAKREARIDYFATSLPTMLLFEDDLTARQRRAAAFMEAQADAGLGERAKARRRLARILREEPAHALAADFLRELG